MESGAKNLGFQRHRFGGVCYKIFRRDITVSKSGLFELGGRRVIPQLRATR